MKATFEEISYHRDPPKNYGERTVHLPFARVSARALIVLEGMGWIHGDGKPSNWILEKSGVLKLADHGLCRPPGVPRRSEQIHGSPPYIAPEQLQRGRQQQQQEGEVAHGSVSSRQWMRRVRLMYHLSRVTACVRAKASPLARTR